MSKKKRELTNKPIFYDINRMPNDGTIILPLSMAALWTYQRPKDVFKHINWFAEKKDRTTMDLVLLYTDSLYFNSVETSRSLKKKISNSMVNHANGLKNLIQKANYIEPAIHFMNWNHCFLSKTDILESIFKISKRAKSDQSLLKCIQWDLGGRELNEANVDFIIEESVVSHFIRNLDVTFPKFLSATNNWSLIAYPGAGMKTETYIEKFELLPKRKVRHYSHHVYDLKNHVLVDYRKVSLMEWPSIDENSCLSAS